VPKSILAIWRFGDFGGWLAQVSRLASAGGYRDVQKSVNRGLAPPHHFVMYRIRRFRAILIYPLVILGGVALNLPSGLSPF